MRWISAPYSDLIFLSQSVIKSELICRKHNVHITVRWNLFLTLIQMHWDANERPSLNWNVKTDCHAFLNIIILAGDRNSIWFKKFTTKTVAWQNARHLCILDALYVLCLKSRNRKPETKVFNFQTERFFHCYIDTVADERLNEHFDNNCSHTKIP